MIEQVLGEGDMPLFLGQFFRATIFLCRFFQFTDAFFGSILPTFAFFLLDIMCIVKQCFGHKIFVMYN